MRLRVTIPSWQWFFHHNADAVSSLILILMYIIIWEYVVKVGQESEFENIYGSNGDWVQLFKQADGFLGTDLLRDIGMPRRYITIDRWSSSEAFNAFQDKYHAEYEAIDVRCEHLTEREVRLGAGSSIASFN